MSWDNVSIQATNKYGESRSPCRIPLVDEKDPVGSPFHRIFKEQDEIQCMVTPIRCAGIFFLDSVS